MKNITAVRRTTIVIVASLAAAVIIHLGLLWYGVYAISADESGRTLDAYTWMTTGSPQSDVWLPFHRIIVCAGLLVWKDLFLVPRLLSFFFGCAVLILMIWMAHEVYHDPDVTAVAAVLSAWFPPRIVLSVVPLTEIEFIAVILTALIFYLRWHRTKKSWLLGVAALCIGIGTTIRYEGWIFAFVLGLFLVFHKEYRNRLFVRSMAGYLLLILLGIFPCYWTAKSFQETHALLGFASAHAERYRRAFHIDIIKIVWHNPVTQLIVQNGLSLNLIGMLPLLQFFRRDRYGNRFLLLAALALGLFALVLLTGAGFTTHNPWRISVLWGCLLVPFTASWIVRSVEKKLFRTLSIMILFMVTFTAQLLWLIRTSEFDGSDYSLGKYLASRLQGDYQHKILLETPNWNYLNVVVAENQPDRFLYNSGYDPYEPAGPIISPHNAVPVEQLSRQGIRWLVFQSALNVLPDQQYRIKPLYRNERWTVYELH